MKVIGLHHIQLAMPPGGEEAARAFYDGLLGIPEVPKPGSLSGRGGAWFESGTLRVHLGVEPDFRPAKKAHPGFFVEDLAAIRSKLESAGYTMADGKPLPGLIRGFVQDPFGNKVELLQESQG